MTRTRYLTARLLQNFGLVRKSKRLTDAAYEMHLMQDGEELLGSSCWKNIEEIDELSHEYWNLRQLERKRKELVEKVKSAEAILISAQEAKQGLQDATQGKEAPVIKKRDEILAKIKSLKEAREEAMAQALATKRKHGALKTKLQVLKDEGADESQIKKCLEGLSAFRDVFIQEKEDIGRLDNKISSQEEILLTVQRQLSKNLEGSETGTNEAYSTISKANQEISSCQADLSAIEEEQRKLYRKIGHFLNLESTRRECQKACQDQRIILSQVKLLLESIRRNRRLVNRYER